MKSSCNIYSLHVHKHSVNLISLNKKAGLDVAQSHTHTLCRTCFSQYQASISSAGVTGRWGLLSNAQNAVRWLAMTGRNSSLFSCPSKINMSNHNYQMLSMHIYTQHMRQYKVLVEAYENGPEVVHTCMYVFVLNSLTTVGLSVQVLSRLWIPSLVHIFTSAWN